MALPSVHHKMKRIYAEMVLTHQVILPLVGHGHLFWSRSSTDVILQRGKQFGISRNVCNVHWNSDVLAGRMMGAAAVARLHANEAFQVDLRAAKDEVRVLRSMQ